MTCNNLEQFSKSSPSLTFCSLWVARELLQYLVHATGRSCSAHLSWVVAQKGIAVFEFSATDHTEAFDKSLQQVTGMAHILRKSWLSPSLEQKLRKLFSLEKGKLFGSLLAPSSAKRGYKRGGLQGIMALNLRECRFRLDVGKKFFTERVLRHCNKLPRKAVYVPSLGILKPGVDGALTDLLPVPGKKIVPVPWHWGWTWLSLRSFHTKTILWFPIGG